MRTVIKTDQAPAAIGPYSQAVQSGDFLFCSGQIPIDPKNGEVFKGPVKEQAELVMKNVGAVLKAGGLDFKDVVKTTIFLTDMNDFAAVNEVYGKHFPSEPPARSTVAVAALPRGVNVEIEVLARRG